jgi:replicative DNA helicase
VAKNRHGSLEKVKLGWIGRFTKFTNLSDDAIG